MMKSVIRWLVDVTRMQFRPGWRLFLTFIPLSLIGCIGSFFTTSLSFAILREQHEKTEYATVMAGVILLDRSLQYATRDLLDLYGRTGFHEMLDHPTERHVNRVAADWITFSRVKQVSSRELQNRKDRYFFADTFKLNRGEVYSASFLRNSSFTCAGFPFPRVAFIT